MQPIMNKTYTVSQKPCGRMKDVLLNDRADILRSNLQQWLESYNGRTYNLLNVL